MKGPISRIALCFSRIVLITFVLSTAFSCSRKEDTVSNVLKEESDSLDIRISSAAPEESFRSEALAEIGILKDGTESRLLLDFPKIKELFEEGVILSSVGLVELQISCSEMLVNPENVLLHSITRSWTPFATWTHVDGFLQQRNWNKSGGDFSTAFVQPDLRAGPGNNKTLAFDLTKTVTQLAQQKNQSFGFLLRVRKSDDNAKNFLSLLTSNNPESPPTSVLVFSRKEDFAQ